MRHLISRAVVSVSVVVGIHLLLAPCALPGTLEGTFDSGGGPASGASYRITGSLGPIAVEDASAGPYTTHGSGPGINPDVKTLVIHASPPVIEQGTNCQLTGTAILDDDSITPLSGPEIDWELPGYPVAAVDDNGLLTAVPDVYSIAPGVVRGRYQGWTAQAIVEIRGPHADSGIPDDWFVRFFGDPPNPAADPTADPSGCGQDNLFKYVAGLDPTSATSVFRLRIEAVAGHPERKRLVFWPRLEDRTYVVQFQPDLAAGGGWRDLTDITTSDLGIERSVIDLAAADPTRFYRVLISYP